MSSFAVTREFDSPPAAVFDVFTKASRYSEYTPIRSVEMERTGEGAADGVGAIRALHPAPLVTVRELVVAYEAPQLFEFEVLSGGGPARAYRGRLTFEPGAAGTTGTRVTYAVDLEPRVPGTGFAVAASFRGAIEVLMRIAAPEARRRATTAEGA